MRHSKLIPVAIIVICGLSCVPARSADWFVDSFDSYNSGNLVGQGGWTGTPGPVRVQTEHAQSGKAAEANYITWQVAGDAHRTVSSGGGYQFIEFDAAMDTMSENVSQNLGYLMIFNSAEAEITRMYYSHQEFKVLLTGAERRVIQGSAVPRRWYHIKLGFNLDTNKMDVWVDGIQVVTSATPYGSGSSIGRITFGQWGGLGSNFTKSETYLDNLHCYGAPSPGVATLLRAGDDWSGWERQNLFDPFVIYDEVAGNYKMYYSSTGMAEQNDSAWDQRAVILATSPDTATWTRKIDDYEPVLYPRKFYQGDLIDFDENSLIFDSMYAFAPCVVKDGSSYKMYYTGWSGDSEHVGGGIENKINFRIGMATSTNLINWTKHSGAAGGGSVLGLGQQGSHDAKGVGQPYVIKDGSSYRMWYEGYDGNVWRILNAVSSDGIAWTRQGVALSPGGVGSADELGVRNPVVILRGGQYELWYQGKSSSSPNYHILRATSQDGLNWTKAPGEVTFHTADALDGSEDIHVGSIIIQPNGSCQVFFSKQDTTLLNMTYGMIPERRHSIYSEMIIP